MSARSDIRSKFLMAAGWGDTSATSITGDASARSYQRLTHPKTQQSAILMDAPPDIAGSSGPFVTVAEYLTATGLSAPKVMAQDLGHGFLLLEDFGDQLFANVITGKPPSEKLLYEAAIRVICHLHDHPNLELPRYDSARMAQATDLVFLHYRDTPATYLDDPAQNAIDHLADQLAQFDDFSRVALRDFHAENLIWLPDRAGVARVGLLDFQDAVQTHPTYDLMSLVRDARRDVSPDLADHLITLFCQIRGYDEPTFRAEAAVISAQRNLRILGIFARLSRSMNKPHYVDLIPRVWGHLQTDLAHPTLTTLRGKLNDLLAPPTPDFLARLRTPCPTLP
ncbi:phosphotransferase [Aliiroseovarius sp. S1339]|uniref:aminoglycoside phosphotransferase family protein n=1 Tax=Aliiroseovarius sp. S1339 TaxID=2936990 RepID=UPI0020BEF6B2|nr:phosphotransferase [Aliiroseovarius sp. S1339]MCK8463314.1 phosphotransferase [Aliiroseovarius sp. S1339]